MSNVSSEPAMAAEIPDFKLCQRFGIEARIVGDVYEVDQHDQPIPQDDLKKWMVTTPAGPFPRALVQSIPLAASEQECISLAVKYLMLRDRDAIQNRAPLQPGAADEKGPPIPTPVYLAFIKDQTYWPDDKSQMVYAVDLVIEVDGIRYQQDELEPATFRDTNEVTIIEGTVYDEWKPLHSVHEHFANWITGHQPTSGDKDGA